MKQAIGNIVHSINIMNYAYAIALPEGNFLVKNGEEEIQENDVGKKAIAIYDPQDQFCTFVCFYSEPSTVIYQEKLVALGILSGTK